MIEKVLRSAFELLGGSLVQLTETQVERFTFFGNVRMDSISVCYDRLGSSKGETHRVADLTASSASDIAAHSSL